MIRSLAARAYRPASARPSSHALVLNDRARLCSLAELRRPVRPVTILLLILGALLMFGLIGWFSRQPVFRSGGWRMPAGLVAIALLFGGLMLSVRGGWIAGLPLVLLAVVTGMLARSRPSTSQPGASGGRMTEAEARRLLGVGPNATPTEIRAAYGRLIRMNHPDAGGTHGLAAQLNAARDRLLGS